MSKSYDEIMEHIEVTPEMRQRILKNIEETDIGEKKRVIRFPQWKRLAAIAACLALVLAGALTLPQVLAPNTPPEDFVANPMADIMEVESAQALSEFLGFEITDLSVLPFEPEKVEYTSYWGDLGEITYIAGERTLVYRKGKGTDDNSGDYNSYSTEKELVINDLTVTLKGNWNGYNLAVWADGEYAYSVYSHDGIAEKDWQRMIESTE